MAFKRVPVKMNEALVREALSIIIPPGDLFEIRILDGKWTASGYFFDIDTAIKCLHETNITENSCVYVFLNHIKDGCEARKQRDKIIENVTPTTSDKDMRFSRSARSARYASDTCSRSKPFFDRFSSVRVWTSMSTLILLRCRTRSAAVPVSSLAMAALIRFVI